MGVHTSAWFGSLQADPVSNSPTFLGLTAAADQILGFNNNNLVPSGNLYLGAAAAVGFLSTAGLRAARLQTPKTLISPVYIRSVNGDAYPFGDNPNVSDMTANPVLMRADEEISASVWVASTAAAVPAVPVSLITWFWDQKEPIPQGDSYWVAFTVSGGDLAATKWSSLSTFAFLDQTTLPPGRYAIRGMQLFQVAGSASAVCGRLVIPNELMRPGALVLPQAWSRPPLLSSDGSLGVLARFNAQQPLAMEFFSTSAVTTPTFLGYLHVVQER